MTKFERLLMFFNIETDQKVLDNIYSQCEMTKSYVTLLLLANFIALFGLITNSSAVIIGAMLISPLMGPIIGFGFAYIASERELMKQSFTTIYKSLIFVILSAAALSYISPLNDVTEQILMRTKPNLYDLFIAIFSGLVVSVSFFSKKVNSLTILTGVAIATSIIPPLSVVGFGIGTGHWEISLGSFLLFLTNFAAIVATTALSGIFFGYKYFSNLKNFDYIKKKLMAISMIILFLTIPLSYTLKQSIDSIKIRRVINSSVADLKNTTIFSVNYNIDKKKHLIELDVALASGKPISKETIDTIKSAIENKLGMKSVVNVTQVALKEDVLENKPIMVHKSETKKKAVTFDAAAADFSGRVKSMVADLGGLLRPGEITGYTASVGAGHGIALRLTVRNGDKCTQQEADMLGNYVRSKYKIDADVQMECLPFFSSIAYKPNETDPTGGYPDMSPIGAMADYGKKFGVEIVSYPETSLAYRERVDMAQKRAQALKDKIVADYKISPDAVSVEISKYAVKEPKVELKLIYK